MTNVNLAPVGVWHVHTDFFLPIPERTRKGKFTWCYVWDDDANRRAHWAKRLGAKQAESYDAILADPNVDAIICEAETCKHADIVIRAAKTGIAVAF